jgi:hypothetical protein
MGGIFKNDYECSDDQIAAVMRRIPERYFVEIVFGEQEEPREEILNLDPDKVLWIQDRAFKDSGVYMRRIEDGVDLIWSPWTYQADTMISFKIARDIEAMICQEGGRAVGKPVASYEWAAKLQRYSVVKPFLCWLFGKVKKCVRKTG